MNLRGVERECWREILPVDPPREGYRDQPTWLMRLPASVYEQDSTSLLENHADHREPLDESLI